MELNFKGLEMQKWHIPAGKGQKVDEKNEVSCLVIMFNPTVTVIKISQMAHFCISYWWQRKISLMLGKMFNWT